MVKHQKRGMSEVAFDEPIMTSMRFNKKIMNWYRKAMKKLLLIRDRGSHQLGEAPAQKVCADCLESFGGYTKVYDAAVDQVCVATMLHKAAVLSSLLPEPRNTVLGHKDFIAELLSKAGQMMTELSDHHAASVLQCYSVWYPEIMRLNLSGLSHDDLVQKCLDMVVGLVNEANSRTIVWSLLALINVQKDNTETAKLLLRALKGKANDADSDILGALPKIMGTLGLQDEEGVLAEHLGVLHDQIEKFRPEAVANLVWGLAKMEHTEGRVFFSRLITQYRIRLRFALPNDIALLIDALSMADYREDMDFLREVTEVAVKHSEYFNKENTKMLKDGLEKLELDVHPSYWKEFHYA